MDTLLSALSTLAIMRHLCSMWMCVTIKGAGTAHGARIHRPFAADAAAPRLALSSGHAHRGAVVGVTHAHALQGLCIDYIVLHTGGKSG